MTRKPKRNHTEPLDKVLLIGASVSTHSVDIELSKVKQDSKRFELLAILENPEACHADRLDLARFLLGIAGYDVEAVLEIIHSLNHWSNYSQNMTYNQVMSVYRWLNRNNNTDISNSSVEGVLGENTFTKVVSPIHAENYEPNFCVIGTTRIECHFKKCDSCKLKVQK